MLTLRRETGDPSRSTGCAPSPSLEIRTPGGLYKLPDLSSSVTLGGKCYPDSRIAFRWLASGKQNYQSLSRRMIRARGWTERLRLSRLVSSTFFQTTATRRLVNPPGLPKGYPSGKVLPGEALQVTFADTVPCLARRETKRPSHGGGIVGMILT